MSISLLRKALIARTEAAERVKKELFAVAGTNVSRKALDLYRQEYNEANDHFMDMGLQMLPGLLDVAESANNLSNTIRLGEGTTKRTVLDDRRKLFIALSSLDRKP